MTDHEAIAKIKPGWWIYEALHWFLVTFVDDDSVDVVDGRDIVECLIGHIQAIHTPTDSPKIETAFKIGAPATVTRAEAIAMLKSWRCAVCEGDYFHAGNTGAEIQRLDGSWTGESYKWSEMVAIRSPGGNVYEITEG